ncbi:hypothetical protein BH24ACT8_BH24ACT8_15830 [soil metagenome]
MTNLNASLTTGEETLTESATSSRTAAAVGLLGSVMAASCVVLAGNGAGTGTGADITSTLLSSPTRFQLTAIIAVYAAAALCVAAVRLGRRIGGDAGTLATLAGVAVSVLMAGYYACFAAGVVVADYVLTEAGPGVGEAALVVLNVVEITRYAPGLLLVAAVLVARRRLPRTITVPAAVLAALTVFPMTSWVAAVLIPVWLGIAAVDPRR